MTLVTLSPLFAYATTTTCESRRCDESSWFAGNYGRPSRVLNKSGRFARLNETAHPSQRAARTDAILP
jgi:hypothetical protein